MEWRFSFTCPVVDWYHSWRVVQHQKSGSGLVPLVERGFIFSSPVVDWYLSRNGVSASLFLYWTGTTPGTALQLHQSGSDLVPLLERSFSFTSPVVVWYHSWNGDSASPVR